MPLCMRVFLLREANFGEGWTFLVKYKHRGKRMKDGYVDGIVEKREDTMIRVDKEGGGNEGKVV